MGGHSSRESGIGQFDQTEWEQVTPNLKNYTEEHGRFTSYRHEVTQEEIDKYDLQFTSEEDQRNYYECSLQRLREDFIVNTIHYINKSVKEFCSSSYRAEVYIQHIPIRLSDITDIPYPQNVYILRNCLYGFWQLFKITGYFSPEEDLVCIDNYGEVKVWMNSDLSKNYPNDPEIQYAKKPESSMVNQIIALIQQNTDLQTCPSSITEYFITKNKKFPTFKEAIEIIDLYTLTYHTVIPQYCESVLEIFRDEQEDGVKHCSKPVSVSIKDEPAIVIGQTLIPKLQIGKGSKQNPVIKDRRSTIKKQWVESERLPINSTDRTKCFRNGLTDRNISPCIVQNQHNAFSNINRLNVKNAPTSERMSQTSKSFASKPNVSFTYGSRFIQGDAQVIQKKDKEQKGKEGSIDWKQLLKYSTGGEVLEDLDPQIAADLSMLLE